MDSAYFSTFLFFFILFSVIFFFVYYGKTIDSRILQFLGKKFTNRITIKPLPIEKSSRYLKRLGELQAESISMKIFTNNLNAVLNRQIVFEKELANTTGLSFIIDRNIYYNPKKNADTDWRENFKIYQINYSELGSLGSSIQIGMEALDQKRNAPLFEILENANVVEELKAISPTLKVFGLPAMNQSWKIYIEKQFIGFAIDWGWMKTITQAELENFIGILMKLESYMEERKN